MQSDDSAHENDKKRKETQRNQSKDISLKFGKYETCEDMAQYEPSRGTYNRRLNKLPLQF